MHIDMWRPPQLRHHPSQLLRAERQQLGQKAQYKTVFFAPAGHGVAIGGEVAGLKHLALENSRVVERETGLRDKAAAFTSRRQCPVVGKNFHKISANFASVDG
jgi:hypothetical protein